jgi:hypothetical protein
MSRVDRSDTEGDVDKKGGAPMTERQGPVLEEVRLAVYGHFVVRQRAPSVEEVSKRTGRPDAEVSSAFRELAEAHVLVLRPGTDEVRMAMPFSAVPTGFTVRVGERSWWANCAWDALGVLAALDADGEVVADDPSGGEDLRVRVEDRKLDPPAEGVVHFAVPAARWWEDIGFT